jgi:hypothetical protein
MTINENITVYRCDFCKKKLFVKKAMERHEMYCGKNPENFKRCADGCIHLEEIRVDYWVEDYHGDGYDKTAKGFRCNKLNKLLYPTIVEKKGLDIKYPDTFGNQEPMPKDCEHFENAYFKIHGE